MTKSHLTTPKTVLVHSGGDLVGDALHKLPFLRALRLSFPESRLVYLARRTPTAFAGSLKPLADPYLDEIQNPLDNWAALAKFGWRVRPDLIIDTQRVVHFGLSLKALIPHRRFVSPIAKFRFSDSKPADGSGRLPSRHHVSWLLDLLELASGLRVPVTYGCAIPDDITAQATSLLPKPPASVIGLAPGAGARRKCWPLVDYIALAWRLQKQGHQVAWLVGPGEGDWLENLRQATPDALFPLQDAAARGWTPSPLLTIALAQRFAVSVANDSGVGHMLAAANTPLISLFGPTDPAKFAPISEKLSILRFDPEQPSLAMDEIFAAVQDWLRQPVAVVAAAS